MRAAQFLLFAMALSTSACANSGWGNYEEFKMTTEQAASLCKSVTQTVVGMSEEDAIKTLKSNEVPYRIVARDDKHYIVTMDFRGERANLEIKKGIVTDARCG